MKTMLSVLPASLGMAIIVTVLAPGASAGCADVSARPAGVLGPNQHSYLAQAAYPPASVLLLRAVAEVAGLTLPLASLETSAQEALETVAGLVAQSEELGELVRTLEAQYDAFVANRSEEQSLGGSGPLPSADELAAELERFLADQAKKPDDPT